MPSKLSKLLPLLLFVSAALLAGCSQEQPRVAMHEPSSDCSRIASLVPRLRTYSEVMRKSAKEDILLLSSKSESSRQCAVQNLLRIAALPATSSERGFSLFSERRGLYSQWTAAVDILGEMRATEALDTLIACLDCNDGPVSLGLGHFPAALAIIKYGDEAVPKLEAVLRQKADHRRWHAALALSLIGGEKVKAILLETLKTETDRDMIDTIRNIMRSWNESGESKR